MINFKKKNKKLKTETFVNQFPILVLVQHNNLSVNEWFDFKSQIQQKKTPSSSFWQQKEIQFLTIKNSLLKQVLLKNSSVLFGLKKKQLSSDTKEFVETLCQGPNVLVGCQDFHQLESLCHYLGGNTKCIFMSCFYKGKILNHLDIKILLKTNSSIYYTLFSHLDKKTEFYSVLQNKLELHPLLNLQTSLLTVISLLKQSKT
jgi:hypothetical protein